jgi:hypothetical protein
MFPVTVTAFYGRVRGKLCKYLTQLLTQMRAQDFEKLFPKSSSIINSLLSVKMVLVTLFPCFLQQFGCKVGLGAGLSVRHG